MKKQLQIGTTGFTFIELLVVLLLVAMVAALSAPFIGKSARSFAFSQQVARLKQLMNYLQRAAVAEQRTYRLTIDVADDRFAVWRERDDSYDPWEPVNDSLTKTALPGTGIHVQAGNNIELVFADSGTITAVEFRLADDYGHTAGLQTSISGEIQSTQ